MYADVQWSSFQKKRVKLTKIWLGLLVFNVFINLDVIQNWLDRSPENASRFVSADLLCSQHGTLGLAPKPESSVQSNVPFLVANLQQTHQSFYGFLESRRPLFLAEKSFFPKTSFFKLESKDPSHSSGLSPPALI